MNCVCGHARETHALWGGFLFIGKCSECDCQHLVFPHERKSSEVCRWFGTLAECRDNPCKHWEGVA